MEAYDRKKFYKHILEFYARFINFLDKYDMYQNPQSFVFCNKEAGTNVSYISWQIVMRHVYQVT